MAAVLQLLPQAVYFNSVQHSNFRGIELQVLLYTVLCELNNVNGILAQAL